MGGEVIILSTSSAGHSKGCSEWQDHRPVLAASRTSEIDRERERGTDPPSDPKRKTRTFSRALGFSTSLKLTEE